MVLASDVKEIIELLDNWKVGNEQGSQLLMGYFNGLSLKEMEELPGITDIDKALEEAHQSLSLLMKTLFDIEWKEEGVSLIDATPKLSLGYCGIMFDIQGILEKAQKFLPTMHPYYYKMRLGALGLVPTPWLTRKPK